MTGAVADADLGTTDPIVAVLDGGRPEITVHQKAARLTPSAVAVARDEVGRLVRAAAARAAGDRQRRARLDARDGADVLASPVDLALREARGRLTEGDLRDVERALAEVRSAEGTEDICRAARAAEQLQRASHAAAAFGRQAAGTGPDAAIEPAREWEVVDA
jgi:molecular chaperone DnaK (HSP70)